MKQYISILIALFVISSSYGQKFYRLKKRPGKVTLTPYSNSEITILRISGLFDKARKVVYLDTLNGFRAEVPKWMEMQETNHLYIFCNTIPREQGRDNAICINSAPLTDYDSLQHFKNYVLEDSAYLKENPGKWHYGEDSQIHSITEEKFSNYGSYKVLFEIDGRKLLEQVIILQTKKSFLCISFMADEDTFDSDIGKFEEFLESFSILE